MARMLRIDGNGAHINIAATDGVENDIDDRSIVVFPRNQEPQELSHEGHVSDVA